MAENEVVTGPVDVVFELEALVTSRYHVSISNDQEDVGSTTLLSGKSVTRQPQRANESVKSWKHNRPREAVTKTTDKVMTAGVGKLERTWCLVGLVMKGRDSAPSVSTAAP